MTQKVSEIIVDALIGRRKSLLRHRWGYDQSFHGRNPIV